MAFDTNPNLWQGEYVTGVNTKAVLGGNSVQAGLWRVEEGFGDKAVFKKFDYTSRLATGNLCGATKGQSGSNADVQVLLTPYHIYDEVCKHDFDNTSYAQGQPQGMFNKELPREVLEAYIMQMAEEEAQNLEAIRWSGDATSAVNPLGSQDGVLTKILASGTAQAVGGASAAAILSPATVIDELNKLVAAAPAAVSLNPDFKIVVSPDVAVAYRQAIASQPALTLATLGMGMTQNLQELKGVGYIGNFGNSMIPMFMSAGFVDNGVNDFTATAIAGVFANGNKGNLIMATDALSDMATINVQDRQAVFVSDPYVDITWQFRQGVEVMRPEQIAYYLGV